ncbi:hypothetical protein [Paludibaculum fermentans]|uniref:hypothetical protein n=1 Tax=Paludibaculum fermentans TaxID=1473598 RepID=UPI003EBCBAE1
MLSSIGSASSVYDSLSSEQTRSKMVDQMFEKVDANRDGKITKNELASSIESDSSTTASSNRKISVDEVFQILDSGGKGYITKQDAADGLEQMAKKVAEVSDQKAEAGAPSGGGGRAGGAGGTESTSSGTVYDPRDTNKDGKVSAQEEISYVVKQYSTPAVAGSSAEQAVPTTYA